MCLLLTGLMESGPGAVLLGVPVMVGGCLDQQMLWAVGQRELAPRAVCSRPGPGLGCGRVRLCGCIWQQGESGWVLPWAGNVLGWQAGALGSAGGDRERAERRASLEPRSSLWFLESKPELPLPEP